MTPEQIEAQQLVEQFKVYFPLMFHKEKTNPAAKQCALIAVESIMRIINGDGKSWDINTYWDGEKFVSSKTTKEYWQKVKEEITKTNLEECIK